MPTYSSMWQLYKNLGEADFHYLWHLKCKLQEQRQRLEQILIDCIGELHLANLPELRLEDFRECCLRLMDHLKEAEGKIDLELASPDWIDCPNCRGEGGKYYYEWEYCQKCHGHGKLRPEAAQ